MKTLLLILFLVISANASAVPFEDLANAQIKVEISPVSIDGKNFAWRYAGGICKALGYTRLVSSKGEPCQNGEDLYAYKAGMGDTASTLTKLDVCNNEHSSTSTRLSSVICAK